ncbi:hypothetical protein CLV36_101412 [Laceyella sediminis]|uniref:Uncharacterized protein n=1 Tax=Laceyella sediminis TaxID=573074 RepID=A0ABX5ETM5_9BACL|nr:hypothetical protein CLV36_101412 [Laceyella sediminis]
MYHFPFAQEFQRIIDVWVIRNVDQPLVGGACFLLSGNVFIQIGDGITLGLDIGGSEWYSRRIVIEESGVVIDKMFAQSGFLKLLRGGVFG